MIRMEQKHMGACVGLFVDTFTNPPWDYGWMRREKIVVYFADLWRTPGFRGFVVLRDDVVCAACLGILTDYFAVPTYEIKEIYVSRTLQGEGIGSAFLAEIEAELAAEGVPVVTLYTQRTIPAYEFYTKRGYAAAHDAVMMNKMI